MADASSVSLGKRLRQERERRQWTQEDLAAKIGRSVPSINRWEHDRAEPQADALKELITLFGKPPERWGMGRWNVPFLRNPYFTGREQLLKRLHRTLAAEKTVSMSQVRVISGLGGIGKTQIVLEYAYRYAHEYEAVLWVQADSREMLVSEFARLAQTLELPEQEEQDQKRVVNAVKRWLQAHSAWLLILDNVDDPTMLDDFLPHGMGGATLVTARLQITGLHLKNIPVERMSRDEGVSFLLQRNTASDEPEVGERGASMSVSEQDRQAAAQLWAVMDGLPLALDQAGAYIAAVQCSIVEYLERYGYHRKFLLHERGGPIPEHPAAVATTWDLSFARVEQKKPAAAALLRLCAFLAPDAIPEELITEGAAHLPAPLQIFGAAHLLDEAIGTLRTYSLLQRDATTRMLSLHRLVQAVLQDKLEETERRAWAEHTLHAVNSAFPLVEYSTWTQCERLLAQALTAAQLIELYQFVSGDAGRLLHETACYLYERGRYSEAEALYLRALQIRERQLGPEHPYTATNLNNLALLYSEQGKYEEAESLYLRALQIRERQLAPEHPDIAQSLNNLANLYKNRGKYREAEPLYQQALRIWERQLIPEQPHMVHPLNNLANLYLRQGKYAEAEPLYLRALRIWERQFGPEHPRVASLLGNLAILYYEQGKYAEAEPLYQQALRLWEQQLGSEHPQIAHTLNNLANLYYEQGKYAEAELLYQRALRIRELHLGPEHPQIAHPLHGLSGLYLRQGKYEQAELLIQRALRIWEQQFGPEHPEVTYILNNLANIYTGQGKYTDAELLYRRVLRIREQHLGQENPDIAETMHDFAGYWETQRNNEEARTWYTRALIIRESTLGAHHPKTTQTRTQLIALLQSMEQHDDATRLEVVQCEQMIQEEERPSC